MPAAFLNGVIIFGCYAVLATFNPGGLVPDMEHVRHSLSSGPPSNTSPATPSAPAHSNSPRSDDDAPVPLRPAQSLSPQIRTVGELEKDLSGLDADKPISIVGEAFSVVITTKQVELVP